MELDGDDFFVILQEQQVNGEFPNLFLENDLEEFKEIDTDLLEAFEDEEF